MNVLAHLGHHLEQCIVQYICLSIQKILGMKDYILKILGGDKYIRLSVRVVNCAFKDMGLDCIGFLVF